MGGGFAPLRLELRPSENRISEVDTVCSRLIWEVSCFFEGWRANDGVVLDLCSMTAGSGSFLMVMVLGD